MVMMPPIRANDPANAAHNRMLMDELAQKGFYHSIPLPDGTVLEGIIPLDVLRSRAAEFPIPERLDGKRILDIGTWDGFFAFEMERRGAQVVAIDNTEVENFYMVRELLGSHAEYHVQDVYELTPERNGYFDIVVFMGVLYHLKHPLLGLERVCDVTTDMAIVESFVTNEEITSDPPALEFYETTELLGQADNWCGPNIQCLLAMCRTAGFARPELIRVKFQRAVVACYRHWLPEPDNPTAAPPHLLAATHSSNYGINVSSTREEYITAFFKSNETALNIHNVFPEVGGYGVPPLAVNHVGGDGWQVSFRVAPGLREGWHKVRLRTGNSRNSNECPIAIDIPIRIENLQVLGAADGHTWKPGEVAAGTDARVSLWIVGLPENADRANVKIFLGTKRLTIDELLPEQSGNRQINVKLPRAFPQGRYDLTVQVGAVKTPPLSLRVV